MKPMIAAALFAVGIAFGALALPHAGPASAQTASPTPGGTGMSGMSGMSMSAADTDYMASMQRMNKAMAAAPMSGDPDHDFITMMIPHHEGAVAMARAELQHGKNSAVKRLAQRTLDENLKSAAELRAQLAKMPR